jgi:hypothetical protein
VETGFNSSTEKLTNPFTINARRGVRIPPGLYNYDESFISVTTNQGAPFSVSGRYGSQCRS